MIITVTKPISPNTSLIKRFIAYPARSPYKVSVRSKNGYETIIQEFGRAKINIFAMYVVNLAWKH